LVKEQSHEEVPYVVGPTEEELVNILLEDSLDHN
jgi:hypothetical protein